jgi:YbgC/YbaW family acyl-CoA thioester hydrolase
MLNQLLTNEPESQVLVRFRDCDPFGHLYTASYIEYLHEALEDHMKLHYGLDIYAHAALSGRGWYVTRNQVAYLAPAKLNETVRIRMRMLRFDENMAQLEGLMFDTAKRHLKAFAWFHFRFVDIRRGRPARISEDLKAIFQRMLFKEADAELDQFEARTSQVHSQFKKIARDPEASMPVGAH